MSASVFTYVPGASIFHRLNPLTSFLAAFFVCIAAAVSLSIPFVAALIVLLMACAAVIGVFKRCLKLVLGLGSLALIVLVLQVLFVRTGEVYLQCGPLMVTHDGVFSGVLVVLKVVCMVLPLTLAFMVAPVNALSDELVSKCHLPHKYAFAIVTAIRFIPLFIEEMGAIMEAQKARGVSFDTGNIFKRLSMMVPLTVPLLVGSVKKTDSIAIAAELRGFKLRGPRSAVRTRRIAAGDVVAVLVCIAALAASIAVNLL